MHHTDFSDLSASDYPLAGPFRRRSKSRRLADLVRHFFRLFLGGHP
jgi:hypothetical protein